MASRFINNIYFLSGTAVIAVAGVPLRLVCAGSRNFALRFELDVNNRELASTLTKLQETEVQLVQSEKMNALGKLSAGLLHEINNPLNFTFMALQVAQQEAAENESMTETLKDIGEGMEPDQDGDCRPPGVCVSVATRWTRRSFRIDEALTSALRLTAHELDWITIDREGVARHHRRLGSRRRSCMCS